MQSIQFCSRLFLPHNIINIKLLIYLSNKKSYQLIMNRDHSVNPDIFTGWQQKQLIVKLHQFPLIFMNPIVDMVSKSLTSFGSTQIYRVVYMGPRHNSNMKAFKSYCQTQKSSTALDSIVYGISQINKFAFKHSHQGQKFYPIRISQYRLFTGMNPTLKRDDLKFDSDFQCGNLDLAIYINPVEYDLVMRVDSNTKGHTAWFYFKVSNGNNNQKVKFNIINFSKKYLLFKDGMKPYIFKKSTGWVQSGSSVTYNTRRLRYQGVQNVNFQCLSFFYQFKDSQQVYFAYCIPYSYSYLLHRLQQLKQKTPHLLKISYTHESTGGLPIPIVTITNFSNTTQKSNIVCTARLHPGQTQGSWMMDGFMQHLLSPESHYLRDKAVFKIVPMVNVDGVVLGNFRTGIMGRDLNRCFNLVDRYAEITIIRKLAQELNPYIFIDFHGHSAKKNVFIYGPDYKLQDRNYLLARLYPKLISKQTQIFRYYSCSFNIPRSKTTTGRAVMLKEFKVQFSYTVEGSAFAFGHGKNQTYFTSQYFQLVGSKISNSLTEFIKILRILPKRQQIKQKKMQQQSKKQEIGKKKLKSQIDEKQSRSQKTQKTQIQKQKYKSSLLDIDSIQCLSVIQKNLLKQIMKDQSIIDQEQKQQGSEDSDYENQTNDYSNSELNMIMQSKFNPQSTKKTSNTQKSKNKRKKGKGENQTRQKTKNIDKALNKNKIRRNKSYSIKQIDSSQLIKSSQTIDVSQNKQTKNNSTLDEKASKILESDPYYMNSIVRRKQMSRMIKQNKQISSSSVMNMRSNNVHYDWRTKINKQESSKHFQFEMPQFFEPILSKNKIQQYKIQQQKKQQIKKTPILSIKKTVLPSLDRSLELIRQRAEKSMLSQILEQHQRKKRSQKNYKIMFL